MGGIDTFETNKKLVHFGLKISKCFIWVWLSTVDILFLMCSVNVNE